MVLNAGADLAALSFNSELAQGIDQQACHRPLNTPYGLLRCAGRREWLARLKCLGRYAGTAQRGRPLKLKLNRAELHR